MKRFFNSNSNQELYYVSQRLIYLFDSIEPNLQSLEVQSLMQILSVQVPPTPKHPSQLPLIFSPRWFVYVTPFRLNQALWRRSCCLHSLCLKWPTSSLHSDPLPSKRPQPQPIPSDPILSYPNRSDPTTCGVCCAHTHTVAS